jgi:hypothetical protein
LLNFNRIIAYLFGSLCLVLPFFVYERYIYLLGFPDGFISKLGYAERNLAYIFMGVSFIFAVGFIYWGKVTVSTKIERKIFALACLYLIFIASIAWVDYYYHLHTDGSG